MAFISTTGTGAAHSASPVFKKFWFLVARQKQRIRLGLLGILSRSSAGYRHNASLHYATKESAVESDAPYCCVRMHGTTVQIFCGASDLFLFQWNPA